MGRAVGIDLGTTNSVIAVYEGTQPTVIANAEGARTTPSVVAFTDSGERLVGQLARRQAVLNAQGTVSSAKRFIGRRFHEVTTEADQVSYEVAAGPDGAVRLTVRGKQYAPEEISAQVLRKLADDAAKHLGEKVTDAVITVPAYFNDAQRQATKAAGRIAGLNVLRIINEPTAASLAYGLDKKKDETIAVFDLGGGTFDISILEVGEGVVEVKAISGDNFLGGDDFDNTIAKWIVEEFALDRGLDLSRDPFAIQLVKEAAVKAKCDLSTLPQISVEIPFLPFEGKNIEGLNLVFTRQKFNEICDELFERLLPPCEVAMKNAGLRPGQVNKAILVGGATRMTRISDVVRTAFGVEPSKSINPDEAVALGAAIQAGILSGEKTGLLLLDVTAHSLGVEAEGGVMMEMIRGNTTIPTRKSEIFSTSLSNQTSVEIHILEGEGVSVADNRSLGRFILEGIAPAPCGVPQIEVTLDIDANGILNVSAKDMATGREQKLTVKATTGLSEYDRAQRISDVREV